MQAQNESPNKHTNPLSQLVKNMFSSSSNNNINNSTIMLAAIVSLLLVILFVLLLHVYAKWFLSQSHQSQLQNRRRQHRNRHPRRRVSGVMGPSQLHHFHVQDSPFLTKGLDSAMVSAIPMFVYETGEAEETEELECVICLCGFEEGEIGRSLPKCGHAFHVECIDMWLSCHCNCPICRAPIVSGNVCESDSHQFGSIDGDNDHGLGGDDHGVVEIVISTPSYEISESEVRNESENGDFGAGGTMVSDAGGGSVAETSSSLVLGCSLKRMLSKIFVSSNVNELHDSQ